MRSTQAECLEACSAGFLSENHRDKEFGTQTTHCSQRDTSSVARSCLPFGPLPLAGGQLTGDWGWGGAGAAAARPSTRSLDEGSRADGLCRPSPLPSHTWHGDQARSWRLCRKAGSQHPGGHPASSLSSIYNIRFASRLHRGRGGMVCEAFSVYCLPPPPQVHTGPAQIKNKPQTTA